MSYACVIAAAGLSSRMKNFKPLMQLGNRTIICHTVSHFVRAGIREIVIVTGHRGDELEAHLRSYANALTAERATLPEQADAPAKHPCDIHFVWNKRFAETSMFESCRVGIRAVCTEYLPDCEGILLSPGDVPLVRPETVIAVRDCPASMVRPLYQGRYGHPVLLRPDVLPEILSFQGDNGLRGAMEKTGKPVADVPVDDPWMLLDADTPADFRLLESLLSQYADTERPGQ